jgi:hypothetical protein
MDDPERDLRGLLGLLKAAITMPIMVAGCVIIAISWTAPEPLTPAPVPWGHYQDLLQTRIDQRAALGDCRGLQREMDTVLAKSDATFADYGHDSQALLDYIAEKMAQADCAQ